MPELTFVELAVVFAGLLLGGLLKGATGAGLPIVAIPLIASVTDIRFAVVLMVAPNLLSNLIQNWNYRQHNTQPILCRDFAIAGAIGALLGTLLLALLSLKALSLLAVCVVFFYILLRVRNPGFVLSVDVAQRWAYPVGLAAGSLQGALSVSAPISITFLHATRQPRATFMFIISVFFSVTSLVQILTQFMLGLSTLQLAALSVLALVPVSIGMPLGDWIGKKMSSRVFDTTILILLIVLALKILSDVLFGD